MSLLAQSDLPPTRSPGLFSRVRRWEFLRLAVYIVGLIVVLVGTKLAGNLITPPDGKPLHHEILLASNLVSAGLLLVAYALLVRAMERRAVTELGLGKGVGLFVVGGAVGLALMASVYMVLWSMHLVTFSPGTGLTGLGGPLAAYFGAAVLEELLLRAVVFRLVEEISGTTIAVVFSAALFGLLHALNPGATVVSGVAIAIEAGVLLAVAYVLTRNLWFAIGIHLGWNFAEGALFGARVSGGAASHALIRTSISGPDLISGGGFGPEASVVSVALSAALSAVIILLILRRAGWRPIAWTPVAA
jgi:hypothetical protein